MVAKIGHGASLFGAISYNQLKVEVENGEVLFAQNIIESPDGNFQMHDILRSFEPYLAANKRTEKPVIHISLNPDPRDNVADETFCEMAQRYMDGLGYGNQPYIVFKHTDIQRKHIHIVSVRVNEDGSCIPDTFEKRRSMEICRALEKDFKLSPADKTERQKMLPLQKVDYGKGNVKRQVSNVVRELGKTYRFQSMGEYRALLSIFNLTVEEVKGERKGEPYNGLVYSVLNEKGEKVGNPFKSSLFGKTVGFEALQKKMASDKEQWKTDKLTKNQLRSIVESAISTSKNRKDFEKQLSGKGINILTRENEQGRIYGITFIDHHNKIVLNGSRLGKEFSANIFHEWFVNGNKPEQTPMQVPVSGKELSPENDKSFENTTTSIDEGFLGAALSLFTPEMNGTDYEEEQFRRKMKRKKKTRKKRKL